MMKNIYEFFSNKTYMLITIIALILLSLLTFYFPMELDITRNRSNSISKETRLALKDLDIKDVEVTFLSAIVSPSVDYEVLNRVSTVFKQFRKYNKHVKYKIVDLTNNPNEISNYEYTDMKGSFIIKYNDKTILIPSQTFAQKCDNKLNISVENVLITELIKLKDQNNYNIHYTSTHGEGLLTDDYSNFLLLMQTRGYNFVPLDLSTDSLDNINSVYILAPLNDFTLDEISKLETLIDNGTNIFISLKSDKSNVPGTFLNLKGLVKKYGVFIEDDVIVDQIQDTKLIGVYENLSEFETYIEDLNSIVYLPYSRKMSIVDSEYYPVSIMSSGELSSNRDNTYSSFPLIIRLINKDSKILISATPELLKNNNITDNKHFVVFLTDWLDNFNSGLNINPFVYTEYTTNPNEFKPSLVFGIIKIIIPCTVLFYAIEIKIKREGSIRKAKSKRRFVFKRKAKRM